MATQLWPFASQEAENLCEQTGVLAGKLQLLGILSTSRNIPFLHYIATWETLRGFLQISIRCSYRRAHTEPFCPANSLEMTLLA